MWGRIQRRRRQHRLALVALTVAGGLGGALLAGRPASDRRPPVQVRAEVEGTLRPDGSAPPDARWRLRFDGAELRLYRNELVAVTRCPGAPGCIRTAAGGELRLPFEAPGEYRALVFSRAVTGGGRTLQEDLEEARGQGGRVEMSPAIVVY